MNILVLSNTTSNYLSPCWRVASFPRVLFPFFFFCLSVIKPRVKMYQHWPEQTTAVIKNETPLVLVGDYIDPLVVRSWLSLLADGEKKKKTTLKRGRESVCSCLWFCMSRIWMSAGRITGSGFKFKALLRQSCTRLEIMYFLRIKQT